MSATIKSDMNIPEPNLNDNPQDESGTHVPAADQATEPNSAVDATFPPGVAVPASPPVTSYLCLMQHFGQQAILHQSFVEVFRNCSFIFRAANLIATGQRRLIRTRYTVGS